MILERISQETGVSIEAIANLVRTASRRYKTYNIKKRTGGEREISQPSPEIKFLQRWIIRNYIDFLPIHECVLAYRPGIGIRQTALRHVKQRFLLKMDFQNFFPSIKENDIRALIFDNRHLPPLSQLDGSDIDAIAKISCCNGELTIGAPSSPGISNAALFGFDRFTAAECEVRSVVYTRYADDLAFSTNEPNVLADIHAIVKATLHERISPQLTLNEGKTVFTSKKRERSVTGLVLSSQGLVSIGRDKKRMVKSLCHSFRQGNLAPKQVSYLRGYLSFVISVEPEFVDALKRKYGADLINQICDFVPIKRK